MPTELESPPALERAPTPPASPSSTLPATDAAPSASAAAPAVSFTEGKAAAVPNGTAANRPTGGWLLGPVLDSLFVANLAWPVVALFAMLATETAAYQTFGYLLAYFVIMPHRWITLPLVFGDRQRLAKRTLAFFGVMALVVVS